MTNKLKGLLKDEQGQGMTEYGLVLGLIAVAVVATLIALRGQIVALFGKANNTVANGVAGLG
jgi:pilus assembly protein Flp/PilA